MRTEYPEILRDIGRAPVHVFPGQGSQTPDMGAMTAEWCPDLVELAHDLTGVDITVTTSANTAILQPAIYCASIAGHRRVEQLRLAPPAAYLGHSLGEIAALAAGGAITDEAGLRLVVRRGELMALAAQSRHGGMTAVVAIDIDVVRGIADGLGLTIATDNAPGEMVLAGRLTDLATAADEVVDRGGKAIPLPIEGAFHSPEMRSIRTDFVNAVTAAHPRRPRVPVISSFTGQPFVDIPNGLGDSLVGAVHWRETVAHLTSIGANDFVDLGPGRVLAKLIKRISPTTRVTALVDTAVALSPNGA